MASVKSLGLHRPTGLQRAVDELALPRHAKPPPYTWDITIDSLGKDKVEDELLVSRSTVSWSRGGIFRKSFNFELEKEPITQALLTYFPAPQDTRDEAFQGSQARLPKQQKLSQALVVVLKTQAHIHFLSGPSHIIHMPFEVESICAAPQGIIIQRKQRTDNIAPVSLKFPKVPPSSFLSSQIAAPSLRESQQTTFSVEGLGKPKVLPMRLSSTLEHMGDLPLERSDSSWPRLVCLTDPLQEVGLVVTHPESASRNKGRRTFPKSPNFLDPAEEILHIEEIQLPDTLKSSEDDSLILVVTINRETSHYSVWRLTYIKNGDAFINKKKPDEIRADRRRSSMQPHFASGTSTPVQSSFRESFGAPLPGKRTRRSERLEKVDKPEKTEKPLDLVKSLDPAKESGVGRRQSRRVSSMLARADLSASQERSAFSDHPQIPNHSQSRRLDSYGSQSGRLSGGYGSLNYNQTIHPSLGSLLEAPVDNVLDELRAGGDFEGFHNMGLDDHDFDGLMQEVMFTKILTSPVDSSNVRYSLSSVPARTQSKVFVLAAPRFSTEDLNKIEVVLGIQDATEKRVQLLIVDIQKRRQLLAPPKPSKKPSPELNDLEYSWGAPLRAHPVVDSCKVTDGELSAILILSEDNDGGRELSIQAPWLGKAPIILPRMLLENERSLQHAGRTIDRDVRQRRSEGPEVASGSIKQLRNSGTGGVVDMIDGEDRHHQIQIQLQPRNPLVRDILGVCRSILSPSHSRKILPGWWHAMLWLRNEDVRVADFEWSALVIHLFSLCLAMSTSEQPAVTPRRSQRSFRHAHSGSFGSIRNTEDWKTLQLYETPNALGCPPWQQGQSWDWTLDDDDESADPSLAGESTSIQFISSHIQHARAFLASNPGGDAAPRSLASVFLRSAEHREKSLRNMFTALHLLQEEQKLNIMTPEHASPGSTELRAVLWQTARWLRWYEFANVYELGLQGELDPRRSIGRFVVDIAVACANSG